MAVKKSVWIRLAIYVPLLGFFGFQAVKRYRMAKKAEAAPVVTPSGPQPTGRTVTLPDGRKVDVYEVSAEEAEKMLGPAPEQEGGVAEELPSVSPTPEVEAGAGPSAATPPTEPAPTPEAEEKSN